MKRAISIGVLVAFAAGCFVVGSVYFKQQAATASSIVHGSGHYQFPCQWNYKDDKATLYNYNKSVVYGSCYIGAPLTHYFTIPSEAGNEYCWLKGQTYAYHWVDWHYIYVPEGETTEQDLYFCISGTPDKGGN